VLGERGGGGSTQQSSSCWSPPLPFVRADAARLALLVGDVCTARRISISMLPGCVTRPVRQGGQGCWEAFLWPFCANFSPGQTPPDRSNPAAQLLRISPDGWGRWLEVQVGR
jgi:hypothetical protein